MDKILESFEDVASRPTATSSAPTAADMDDVADVMKALTDEMGAAGGNGGGGGPAGTTVEAISRYVDKAALAKEKVAVLEARQAALERRHAAIVRRISAFRTRAIGTHVAGEIAGVRTRCGKAAKRSSEAMPSLAPPKISAFSLSSVLGAPPLNVPDGIVLPDAPVMVKEEPKAATATPADPPMSKADREKADETLGQLESNLRHLAQGYDSEATESSSGGESCDEFDRFSHSNTTYMSIKKRAKYVWLANRADVASKWTWLTAQIADLEYRIRQQTEFYRQIRAAKGAVTLGAGEPIVSWPPHARKAVTGQPPRADADVPLSCAPAEKNYSRLTDSSGRKIIIKVNKNDPAEAAPSTAAENDNDLGSCRTRPIKMVRRRRILSTKNFYRQNSRASKESSVRCDCVHPNFWCPICYGRRNHTQAPEPLTQDRAQCMALLDHSYHQVLSTRSDVKLDIQMMQKIKNRSWLAASGLGESSGADGVKEEVKEKKKVKRVKKDSLTDSAAGAGSADFKKKVKKRDEKGLKKKSSSGLRRKSLTVHHHDDGKSATMHDLGNCNGDDCYMDGSPLPSPAPASAPSTPHPAHSSSQAWMEHFRRKRETAFDINNIVIPYSMAAATRVERLKYKEILTPTWRVVAQEKDGGGKKPAAESPEKNAPTEKEAKPSPQRPKQQPAVEEEEDVTDSCYEMRHSKAELEEIKRWQSHLPGWKSSGLTGGQRSRNRRQDSRSSEAAAAAAAAPTPAQGGASGPGSGYNTPDPLSPGTVDKVDTLEVNTRPSTPENAEDTAAAASATPGSIRNRRRTSSATKSRDRNPSEDASAAATPAAPATQPSSRCTTPQPATPSSEFEVAPFEPRLFPLTEAEYEEMLLDMPASQQQGSQEESSQPAESLSGKDKRSKGRRRSSSMLIDELDEDEDMMGDDEEEAEEEDAEEEEDVNDEDPDWNEDPDDPEWTSEKEEEGGAGGGGSGAGAGGGHKGASSASASKSASKKKSNHGLSLKMPKH